MAIFSYKILGASTGNRIETVEDGHEVALLRAASITIKCAGSRCTAEGNVSGASSLNTYV
jgi:hypothetical protein